jgi:hypothetical protein
MGNYKVIILQKWRSSARQLNQKKNDFELFVLRTTKANPERTHTYDFHDMDDLK